MKTYVLGAGASFHAGYPLAGDMGARLIEWMRRQNDSDFRGTADWIEAKFGAVRNIEDLFTNLQMVVQDFANGTLEQRAFRSNIANFQRPNLIQALRQWFAEIRDSEAKSYRQFVSDVLQPGDCIITFNYDVSLDRELHRAGKWEIGDGYGFVIEDCRPTRRRHC